MLIFRFPVFAYDAYDADCINEYLSQLSKNTNTCVVPLDRFLLCKRHNYIALRTPTFFFYQAVLNDLNNMGK